MFMSRICLAGIAAAAISVSFSASEAQQQCTGVLQPRVEIIQKDVNVMLSYLYQINKDNFEDAQKSASASGSYLDIISGSANYDEFASKRAQLAEKYKFTYSLQDMSRYYRSGLDQGQLDAFNRCIQVSSGLSVDLKPISDDFADVFIQWRRPPNGFDVVPLVVKVVSGGTISAQTPPPRTMKSDQREHIAVSRAKDQDLYLIVTAGEESQPVTIPHARDPKAVPLWQVSLPPRDWGAHDAYCSRGSIPLAERCDDLDKGRVAVCWENRPVGYNSPGDCRGQYAWCTYKNVEITASTPTTGYNPGRVFVCQ